MWKIITIITTTTIINEVTSQQLPRQPLPDQTAR